MNNSNQNVELSENKRESLIAKLTEELPVLRTKLGLSQDELSNMIGLTRQTYSTLETQKRKMTWSVFLSLLFIFDNNEKTHDYVRTIGVFPDGLFPGENDRAEKRNVVASQYISPDLLKCLDEQAIHSIETMIMVEYARCNNLSGESVVKAFNGKRFEKISDRDVLVQQSLNALKM